MTDTQLLDFLESCGEPGLHWVARPSSTGRGYRLHQTRHAEEWLPYEASRTARGALRNAMKQAGQIKEAA